MEVELLKLAHLLASKGVVNHRQEKVLQEVESKQEVKAKEEEIPTAVGESGHLDVWVVGLGIGVGS
jgi:hypothetical protein